MTEKSLIMGRESSSFISLFLLGFRLSFVSPDEMVSMWPDRDFKTPITPKHWELQRQRAPKKITILMILVRSISNFKECNRVQGVKYGLSIYTFIVTLSHTKLASWACKWAVGRDLHSQEPHTGFTALQP